MRFGRGLVATALALLAAQSSFASGDERGIEDELSVAFRVERLEGDDTGSVVGTVENRSRREYPCVRLEFALSTRFDLRRNGEPARHLGSLVAVVEGVEALSVTSFEKTLPFPAALRFGSIAECQAGHLAANDDRGSDRREKDVHRHNAEIEEMEREARELEKELEELEGGTASRTHGSSETATTPEGRTEVVTAKRGQPGRTTDYRESEPSTREQEVVEAQRAALPAPSNLVLSKVGTTTLTLHWRDNATTEEGVYVERGTPTKERSGTNYRWKQVFAVEERVLSRVSGTGPRSDSDDGLQPGMTYCYRLRAYRGASKSGYSQVVCTRTK